MIKKASVAAGVAAVVMSAGPAAFAAFSWQGSDYSFDSNSKSKITSCDKESDSHRVHADYKLSNSTQDQVTDSDGNNGVCASESGWYSPHITQHRTCEEINFQPDPCSSWVAAG